MKNILLSMLFILANSSMTFAQYVFSAQVSSGDDCCIAIEAGVHSGDGLENTWSVVVDGITTYNTNSPEYVGSNLLHCFDGNGTHTVNFYINGQLDDSETVEITDCQGDCSICDIPSMVLDGGVIDSCARQIFFCPRFPNINGQIGYSDSCTNPVYTWDYGDGSPIVSTGSQTHTFYNYAQPGTYTICVTLSLTNPNGGTCVTSECAEVVVPDVDSLDCQGDCSVCDIPSMILDGDIIDTCARQVWLDVRFPSINGQIGYSDSCTNPVYTWDYGDGSPIANTGAQSYVFYNYAQPGTYTACVTLTLTNPEGGICVRTECVQVVVTGCVSTTCCGLRVDGIRHFVHPKDPCLVLMMPINPSSDPGACSNYTSSWDIGGDGTIDGIGTNFFTTFTTSGPQTVCLTMSFGNCSVTECTVINVVGCGDNKPSDSYTKSLNQNQLWDEALEEIEATTLELFPNPVSNELTINLSADIDRIQLIDLTGRVVSEQQVNNTTQLSVEVHQLSPGIYFVKAMDANGELKATERFVKLK